MPNIKNFKSMSKAGFTLIELLIVIAILGVLAVVVLLALNPVQQLARTRDSGRISAVTQLGHALEAYATSRNGAFVVENDTWVTSLVNAGEISTVPTNSAYSAGTVAGSGKPVPADCAPTAGVGEQGGYCYNLGGASGPFVVYAHLESAAQNSRCPAAQVAIAAYSSEQGRGGITCIANYTTAPATAGLTFLQ